ncbi:MAG: DNA-binding protein [Haliea sp.]|jgi:putative hydrolase|nr:DNA-binding protein [Haliea sp.]
MIFAMTKVSNRLISERLNEYAEVLAQQQANRFRITAYQRAANTIEGLEEDVEKIYRRGGVQALVALPNIGKGIAAAIVELLHSGRFTRLERIRGELEPDKLFQTLPGIGPKLAKRIQDDLGIDTLEELEIAAHEGRLEQLSGVSHGRSQIIRAALETMLARPRATFIRDRSAGPSVAVLLQIDGEYRDKANHGQLPTIAPRRFNPDHVAWLPIMHTIEGDWHFTALFSNTGRAHELNRTRDWVVIYFYDDHHQEGQHTVVTETQGPLKGKRVVRGRELECKAHYE